VAGRGLYSSGQVADD